MLPSIAQRLASELNVREAQVAATVALLDEGASVPFISRYRKEATGALDDTQLRNLDERLRYLRELEERRTAIVASVEEQGKLTDELKEQLLLADTKQRLEDLYLPYKPKRRTKAQIAREAGIEPLADALLENPKLTPETQATAYINTEAGFADEKAVLDGAKQILMERFSEEPELSGRLRDAFWQDGLLSSRVIKGQEDAGAKFRDYFEQDEKLAKTPSHRALAMFRGRNEGFLSLSIKLAGEEALLSHPYESVIAERFGVKDTGRAADKWLNEVVRWTWKVKLYTRLETELLTRLRELAEEAAIQVFADNLKDVLLAAPAGPKTTLALDPGIRTGCKVAVVDATGKLLDHATIYPHQPKNQWRESLAVLAALCQKHQVELIAIGNGTASRETDKLVGELLASGAKASKVMVNEAGASIYSASEFAAREFPDLDVTIRGAVSIGRRLQDPLAELVKIEPKSIGVGQYQHDVSQVQLARSLDAVVEDCVNGVGVDLNMASAPLLARTSGLSTGLAENIVALRDEQGAFTSRRQLLDVKRLGPKAYEQCAGFLRIRDAKNPLDASAVHPEAYPLVEKIAKANQRDVASLIGDTSFLKSLNAADYTDERFGLPTVTDILKELDKPGRDPRPEFKAAEFLEGVEDIKDLKPGMVLEGVVTNVANFGAFVDIGVHQDGLVHISALADTFIKDPRDVVKAGDIIKVKVMEIDVERRRIALSCRMSDQPGENNSTAGASNARGTRQAATHNKQAAKQQQAVTGNTLGDLLLAAQKKKQGK
ncbi:Tex family protein [Marinospirillum insulare]|uniref:RNA-binding transcriptional accessory protein n=1 Tax=Marinospirillum insulare TaxID=217169 RepID=A0ABQ5ZUF1_9GAMM|nr:Tex family protein [Marinospirillum insulare]GLR63032.1 RNA-binding transcriptional accessory protein [Marinospirillum insulare]